MAARVWSFQPGYNMRSTPALLPYEELSKNHLSSFWVKIKDMMDT